MRKISLQFIILSVGIACLSPVTANNAVANNITILQTLALPKDCFTQGFIKTANYFYLSCGRYGQSRIIKLNLQGELLEETALDKHLFAEGLALANNKNGKLLNLTWRENQALLFNSETLTLEKTLKLQGEGWGLTNYNEHWLKSDGSHSLTLLDKKSLKPIQNFYIFTAEGKKQQKINELEITENYLIANIWQSQEIIFIALPLKKKNRIAFRLNLKQLAEKHRHQGVLNGIAVDKNVLWITGKNWGKAYAIALPDLPGFQKTF